MSETQYTPHYSVDGTSNVNGLLFPHQLQAIRMIQPRDMEKVFGPGIEIDLPSKGYTDPEWYWQGSNGCVWGIGWRWGAPRLRGRGAKQKNQSGPFWVHPREEDAADFVNFLVRELSV